MVISGFYENVPLHVYEHRELASDEKEKNLVLEFDPEPATDMLIACGWDRWTKPGEPDLYSFAAITDEPTPELSATGHQRTVITIEEAYLSEWLNPVGLDKQPLEHILSDKKCRTTSTRSPHNATVQLRFPLCARFPPVRSDLFFFRVDFRFHLGK
jgi:putative SOS response-associated peptidase YedK